MEAGIQQRLAQDGTVVSLIGTRLYPLILPDEPLYPSVTYQRISTVRDYATTGVVSLTKIRLQIDVWSQTYSVAKQVDNAIRASLESFTGNLPDGTQVGEIQFDSSQDLYESASRTYRVSTDYMVWAVI